MTNQSPEQLRALAGKLRTFVNQLDSPVLHKALNQAADGVDQAAKAEEQIAAIKALHEKYKSTFLPTHGFARELDNILAGSN